MFLAVRFRVLVLGVAVSCLMAVGVVGVGSGSPAVAATTFVVDTTTDTVDADSGDGVCADAGGKCSLRAAVMQANASAGADTIVLPAGIYTFATPGAPENLAASGDLDISDDLTISGAGATNTVIDAAGLDRVFEVRTSAASVSLSGVTLSGGAASASGGGLAVVAAGSVVTVSDSVVSGNVAGAGGGGVYVAEGATVAATSLVLSGNNASIGGGVESAGWLTIDDSIVTGNDAVELGGGIRNFGGTLEVRRSAIIRNTAGLGGGIESEIGTGTITNSTISGNAAEGVAGVGLTSGSLSLVASTVAFNEASNGGGGVVAVGGTVELARTIVANNTAPFEPDCGGRLTLRDYNLIGNAIDSCNFIIGTGDQIGSGNGSLDPMLGPLQDNGAGIPTHALLSGSLAIDAVPVGSCLVDTDARGVTRPQGPGCDIGAFEATAIEAKAADSIGVVDPELGLWTLSHSSTVTFIDINFYFGNPRDVPFVGDWDCDGVVTPGLFRTSDAFAYLRNSNSQGVADVRFFFGNPSDVPLAGDWDGDGCDTLSIYRPSEQRFYIVNELGQDEGGLGAADYSFLFGNPGDKPVVGDWDGDGVDEVGLHRESTGFFYWRTALDTGVADGEIFFGDPGDRFVAGDWGVVDGVDTPGLFRPSDSTFYFRHTLTQGVADSQLPWYEEQPDWLPVAGAFGPLPFGRPG